jgi:hypothetical protein
MLLFAIAALGSRMEAWWFEAKFESGDCARLIDAGMVKRFERSGTHWYTLTSNGMRVIDRLAALAELVKMAI